MFLFACPVVLTVDYLDLSNPEKGTFPRFQDIQEAYSNDLRSSIHFPEFNLRAQGHKGTAQDPSLSSRCSKLKVQTLSSSLRLSPVEPTPAPPAQTDPPGEEEHTVSDRRRRHLEPAAPLPVAVVIVYKSLGKLLPERYDPDRRSLR